MLEDEGISGASFGHAAFGAETGGGVRDSDDHQAEEDGAYDAHEIEGWRIQHAHEVEGRRMRVVRVIERSHYEDVARGARSKGCYDGRKSQSIVITSNIYNLVEKTPSRMRNIKVHHSCSSRL